MTAPSIIDFLDDPALLGAFFTGASWDRWRAVLKAAFALPMTDRDLELFREVAGDRAPPSRRVRELVCAVGRGGGKDSIASALAAYIAVTGDFSQLRPGERGTVLCLATDREQAAIAHSYIAGYFQQVPMLAQLVEHIGDDAIDLNTGAQIIVGTNSLRAPRGRTICAAIYDEVAFWYSNEYANPDVEVDAAISPGLMRFAGSLKILISSVNKRSGILYEHVAQFFGKDDDDVLVVMGESLQFNNTLDPKEIDRQLARDYERASAEYLCKWRDDLSTFIDRALVEAATDQGVIVRPPQPGIAYSAFADPSGGRGDSFTTAIAHAEGDTIVLDCLYERRAPFDPSSVVAEIAALLRSYQIAETTGDRYAANWVTEGFAKEGIAYRPSERDKSNIFLDALPLFTTGRARILDDARLHYQFISLERRTSRIGRDIVTHPDHRNAHDDAANAAAGALVLASSNAAPFLWHRDDLFTAAASIPWPVRCVGVFATAAVDQRGVTIAFWATGADRYQAGPPCLLIDYSRSPMTPTLFTGVATRLSALAEEIPRDGAVGGIICAGSLAAHAQAAGLRVTGNADAMLAPAARPALILAAATQIGMGAVKISNLAEATSLRLPLPIGEIAGDPSAAGDAALLGIGAVLPQEMWPPEWEDTL